MKFRLNTKPLKDALDLAIIDSNISKFYQKSTVVELTVAGENEMRLNTESNSVLSEAVLKGDNSEKGYGTAIVDCSLFKKLVSSINDDFVIIDFDDNSIVIHAGKSEFTVPKMLQDEEVSLDRPVIDKKGLDFVGELHPETWQYIRDHQLYAVAMSQSVPVYTRVWSSKDQGVLTGDVTLSFFTHQPNSDLESDCLVLPSIVNLLSSLDACSKMYKVNDTTYLVEVERDAFTFCSQFSVELEDPDTLGEYDSDMIFSMVMDDSVEGIKLSMDEVLSNIKRAQLFSSISEPTIAVHSASDGLYLVNDNVNCKVGDKYDIEFKSSFNIADLSTVISHLDSSEDVVMYPIVKNDEDTGEEEVFGARLRSGDLVALIGSLED